MPHWPVETQQTARVIRAPADPTQDYHLDGRVAYWLFLEGELSWDEATDCYSETAGEVIELRGRVKFDA